MPVAAGSRRASDDNDGDSSNTARVSCTPGDHTRAGHTRNPVIRAEARPAAKVEAPALPPAERRLPEELRWTEQQAVAQVRSEPAPPEQQASRARGRGGDLFSFGDDFPSASQACP